MAQKAAKATGSSPAFLTVCLLTLVWLASGPLFHWSDTWQLVINTVSNIVAMLMLFLIQNTQNRESAALQLKADELLRAVRGAQNAFINLEELSEEDLIRIKERYAKMAELARAKAGYDSIAWSPSRRAAGIVCENHAYLREPLPHAVNLLQVGNEPFIFDVALLLVWRAQDGGGMNGGRHMRRPGISDELPAFFRQAIGAAKDGLRGRGAQAHDDLGLDQIDLRLQPRPGTL